MLLRKKRENFLRCNKTIVLQHLVDEPRDDGGENMHVDVGLIRTAKIGDKESFSALYEQVAPDLYKFALYTLGNAHDAQDAVSETFLEAYKGIGKLRDESSFKPWIMKIASIRCKRKIGQYVKDRPNIDLDELLENPSDSVSLEEELTQKSAVYEALTQLNPQERMIVILSVVQGYTTKEISQILACPHGTVSSKLHRTLKKLRSMLE